MRIKLNKRLNLLLVVVMTTGSLGYAEEHRPNILFFFADDWGRYAKVIVLTALEDIQTISETLEYGAHEYMVKNQWNVKVTQKVPQGKSPDSPLFEINVVLCYDSTILQEKKTMD